MISPQAAMAQGLADSPQGIVREAVANELRSPLVTHHCSYEYHRDIGGTEETRRIIQSSDLLVEKLIRVGNAPVSQDEEQKENQHLWMLLGSARDQEEQRKSQQKAEEHIRALVEAVPDAFRFTEVGFENGSHGEKLLHYSFQPAPDFKPKRADLEVLRAMAGTIIIDEAKRQIVKFEARLFRDVDFGWGVLVHLSKGGNLVFEREAAIRRDCNINFLSVNAYGRILLVKKLEVHWTFDHFQCFRHSLNLASAVAMLTAANISPLDNQTFLK
jgi:hypothetical protein